MCLNLPILQICRVYKRQPIVAMPTPTAVYDTDASMLMFFFVYEIVLRQKQLLSALNKTPHKKLVRASRVPHYEYMCNMGAQIRFHEKNLLLN